MAILKPKETQNETTGEQAAVVNPIEQSANTVFVPKTETIVNIILNKLSEAIRDAKQVLLDNEPHIGELNAFIQALKEDIVELTILKNHFKKEY